jgi:hypothetical protein
MLTFGSVMRRKSSRGEGRLASAVSGVAPVPGVIVGVVVTALVFGLYLVTLAPTTLPYDLPGLRDAGVLQVKASVLGIPDFTGYPTWVMLGKLFTYLPFGDVAYRVNLSSAVYAALAVLFVYLIGLRLTRRIPAAVTGALAFGLGRVFWSQAVIAEVYTLNALLVAVTLYALLVWRDTRRDRYLLLVCFLMGFALTDHLTSGLLVPAALVFVGFVEWRKLVEVGLVLKGAGLFLLGLLPYAYIPLRASMDYLPRGFEWGQPMIRAHPPDTFYGFWVLVSGGNWKDRMFSRSPRGLLEQLEVYIDYLTGGPLGQFNPLLLLAAGGGLVYLALRDRPAAGALGLLFCGWLVYSLGYDIEDIYVYFIPTYLVLCVWMSVGLGGLLDAAGHHLEALGGGKLGGAATSVLAVLFVGLPFTGVGDTFARTDMSQDYRGREIIQAVARDVEPGATVLHHRSPLNYMVLVQERRTDIELIGYREDPIPPGLVKARRALKDGPVYVLFPGNRDTPYYAGVETTRMDYQRAGMTLRAVDRDARLYRVLRDTGGPPEPAPAGSQTERAECAECRITDGREG